MKIQTLIDNNHLDIQAPNMEQLRNYIYRHKIQLFADNYPQVKNYLTEVCQKTLTAELHPDEMFFIYSDFKEGDVSI